MFVISGVFSSFQRDVYTTQDRNTRTESYEMSVRNLKPDHARNTPVSLF